MNVKIKVVKRDGREKDFDINRITWAVNKAYEDVHKEENPAISESVALSIHKKLVGREEVEIETIQDMVVSELEKYDKSVAKSYQRVRRQRAEERVRRSDKEKYYTEVLKCTNVDNDNANVNQYSFGGRKYRIADQEQKEYALRNLVHPKVREKYEEGLIYPHDLSSYSIGDHNCLFIDFENLLANGFETRNCDVRPANSLSTAMQLVAVIFQCQSQEQYGGVGSNAIDYQLAPYVRKSFKKHFKDGIEHLGFLYERLDIDDEIIFIDNKALSVAYSKIYEYAMKQLEKEGKQSAQALYHNLGTLESRPGSQLPFTSINYGTDTSTEGRMVSKWLLEASVEGVGRNNRTSIFPIGIFKHKKGVNDKEGTPNYDLKKLAMKSLSKRIYPNIVNCNWSANIEDPSDYNTECATMGCRTMIGRDIHTNSYSKVGRGNISPVTIILSKLGLDYGIALGKRDKADLEGFYKAFDETLELTRQALIDRYNYITNQSKKSAPFMYNNGTIKDYDKCGDTVEEAMKHGTNGVGILDMAGCCKALFGKHHGESEEAYEFAMSLVKKADKFCKDSTEQFKMNFSLYFTPAENLCNTALERLKGIYGVVEGITDRDYLTNSVHIPVWHECGIFEKLELEAPFTKYGTGGCITYIELDSSIMDNEKAIEDIINYAMDLGIPYLAFNFPIDTCLDCGFQGEFNDSCIVCGSKNIEQLRRVTGYLSTDYRNFNKGKQEEVRQRIRHSRHTNV